LDTLDISDRKRKKTVERPYYKSPFQDRFDEIAADAKFED